MIEIQIGESNKISLDSRKDGIFLNDKRFEGEIIKDHDQAYKVYHGQKIYHVEVLKVEGKTISLKIDDHLIETEISDHMDQILEKLGMNVVSSNAVTDIKAPMPGSILSISVEEGQEVQKGDPLLILEAMKMENVIKSPGDGTVKKIHIANKENVEKNQVLITFD